MGRCGRSRKRPSGFAPTYPRASEAGSLPGPLEGQVAIVTGSSRGMGRVTAAHLASLGAKAAVCYVRNKDMAEELVAEIGKAGGEADAFGFDLTTEEGAAGLIEAVVKRFGRLDVLVCNVGGFLRKPFEETSTQECARVRSDTATMFFCIRAALPHMWPPAPVAS